MCDRIKKDTEFSENITPIRFRTTVLTDIYDQTTADMTLKYYVKGREDIASATAAVGTVYTA